MDIRIAATCSDGMGELIALCPLHTSRSSFISQAFTPKVDKTNIPGRYIPIERSIHSINSNNLSINTENETVINRNLRIG